MAERMFNRFELSPALCLQFVFNSYAIHSVHSSAGAVWTLRLKAARLIFLHNLFKIQTCGMYLSTLHLIHFLGSQMQKFKTKVYVFKHLKEVGVFI